MQTAFLSSLLNKLLHRGTFVPLILFIVYLGSLIFLVSNAYSCDVCNMYDYAGRQNQSYVGMFYRYKVMNGYNFTSPQNHQFFIAKESNARLEHSITGADFYHEKTVQDFEKQATLDLRFNFAIKEKWNIGGIVPGTNSKVYFAKLYSDFQPVKDSMITTQGLGDILVFTDYVFSYKQKKIRLFIKPGVAIKLPTGKSNFGNKDILYPHEVQPGTGTFDGILRLSTNFRRNNYGVELIANYRFNSKSKHQYKFGNSLNVFCNPYYVFEINDKLSLIPKLGAYLEWSSKDKVNSIFENNTGGRTLYYNVGLDAMIGSFGFQSMFQKPFGSYLYGEQMGSAGRFVLGIAYFFKI